MRMSLEEDDPPTSEERSQSATTLASRSTRHWSFFGRKVPKEEIVFFCQIVILYTVIVWSFYNLTADNSKKDIWITLLSSSIGYILPHPTLKRGDL